MLITLEHKRSWFVSNRIIIGKAMQFRRDIQILRGLAVFLVLLFHFGVSGFAGGFLGVDIFFVISGFLMATLYQKGKPLQFYQRRAKRLLPAYFATVLATLIAASVITLPVDFNQVVEQVRFASLFTSNIGFWIQNSYFSQAEFTPLLHLWSLGVEIQFYLIVPVLFWFGRKFRWILPLLLVAALIACFVVTSISPKTSFFMMPLRTWQFLIGWIIAWHLTNAGQIIPRKWNGVLGTVSLIVLVAIPLMPIDPEALNVIQGHPGLMTLVVCIATAGVLAFALPPAIESSVIGRAFELLGRYSYSIYLVHFPILVLALYQPFSGTQIEPRSVGLAIILIMIIAALSLLSYHGIEKIGARLYSARRAVSVVFGVLLLTFIAPLLVTFTHSDAENRIFAAWTDRSTYRCGKIFRILNPTKIACEVTNGVDLDAPTLLLVGNSHADAIKSSLANVSEKLGYHLYFLVANNPLMTPSLDAKRLTLEAKALGATAVIIHNSSDRKFEHNMEAFRASLAAEGIRIVLLMPIPKHSTHIPSAIYRNHTHGAPLPKLNFEEHYKKNQGLFDYARLQETPAFSFYDLAAVLCQPDCRLTDNLDRPAYFDKNHLTLSGARMLEGVFSQAISGLTENKHDN